MKRTSVQQASPSPTPTETMTIRALDTLETHASSYVTTAARCPARTRAGLTGRSLEGRVWWLTAAQASMVSMLMRLHHARVTLALEETAVSRHATKATEATRKPWLLSSRVVLMVNGVETWPALPSRAQVVSQSSIPLVIALRVWWVRCVSSGASKATALAASTRVLLICHSREARACRMRAALL